MMQRWGQVTQQPALAAVSSGAELLALRAEVDRDPRRAGRAELHPVPGARDARPGREPGRVRAAPELRRLARAPRWPSTRPAGPSPGSRGQDYLSPALVQELAPDVLRHRLGLTYEAEAAGDHRRPVIAQVVSATPVRARLMAIAYEPATQPAGAPAAA